MFLTRFVFLQQNMGKLSKQKRKTPTQTIPKVPVTNQTRKIGKKERLRSKKKVLREKLHASSISNKKARLKKAVPVLNNMKSMRESLKALTSSVEESEQKKIVTKDSKVKQKGTQKLKKRKQNFLSEVKLFGMIAKHHEFRQDPLGIISSHIEAKALQEQENRSMQE